MNTIWRAFEADALQGKAEGPYPGLRPFLPRERDIFFGREQMIDEVLVRLAEKHMVVVHGASGCGKSSLIAAGVLPQLARRRERRSLKLRPGTFRPGSKPMQSLVGLLGELCGTKAGPASIEDVYCAISGGSEARAGVARLAAAAGVDQICIVIDQFEELFRFAEDEGFEEAQRFAELLVQLCGCGGDEASWRQAGSEDGPAPREAEGADISFILTMRSEFLGNCARYPGLAEAINRTQYLLPNMVRADLIRAIREPAEVFEGSVDHALAERMASDAAREEDSLPLVQHALMQMWHASDDGRLTLADYERALEACAQSEASRQRGPLSAILAGHADRVLAEVAGDQRKLVAAEFIFRALTRKDSESRAIRCPQRFRRLARLSGVSEEETLAIVNGFRRDGVSFLTPYAAMAESIDGDTVIDISHEALIRAWPRMSDKAIDTEDAQPVGWIEREAQDAMLWRWLSVHAQFFRANPRAYLYGATTERLRTWFARIEQRPEWVRPHLLRPEGKDDVTEEPEWREVEHLLEESYENSRLDRKLLKWWRRLGWLSFVLLILAVGGGAYVYTKWPEWMAALRNKGQVEANQGRRTVSSIVREGDALLNDRDKITGAAADVEVVDERTAEAATAGGSFINTPNGQGYVWVGTTMPGRPSRHNLQGAGDLPIDPDKVRLRRYWMLNNTIVRRDAPTPDEARQSVGVVARRALVRIMALAPPVTVGDRTEYWARIGLARTDLSQVRLSLAHAPPAIQATMTRQLGNIGYRIEGPGPGDATGRADVTYCHQQDRRAAVQLAATVTRWIAQNMAAQGTTVTPLPGDDCDGVAPGKLTLMLDLAPTTPTDEGP